MATGIASGFIIRYTILKTLNEATITIHLRVTSIVIKAKDYLNPKFLSFYQIFVLCNLHPQIQPAYG